MTLPDGAAQLISMAEIAELAGVRRPVVSTWRRRHAAFPPPAAGDHAHPLFDCRQVVDWLVETGRVERSNAEGDLRLYTLARLGAELPPRALIASLTALICLRHLTDDEPLDDGSPGLLARLRARAQEVDPGDELLLSEITTLRKVAGLPRVVDELVEAAYGTAEAFERVMAVRDRLGARELSADRIDPALLRLVVQLTDAVAQADRDTDGIARIADPYAGSGDLLLAVASALREDQEVRISAACADPYTARLTRRWLTVRDLHEGAFKVFCTESNQPTSMLGEPVDGTRAEPLDVLAGPLEKASVIVTLLPYQPAEERSTAATLNLLDTLSLQLTPGAIAVMVAPADSIGALVPGSEAGTLRSELLASGAVKAIIRLPGGLVPYRPGYEVALWVLSIDYSSALRGRVLVADVSDRDLAPAIIDALAMDVLTWRGEDFDPDAHSRTHAVQMPVSALVKSPRPLTPRYLPAEHELFHDVPERVARALDLERILRDLRPDRPMPTSGLATRPNPAAPRTATIAELTRGGRSRTNRLSLLKGTRIAPGLVHAVDSAAPRSLSYPVLGPVEVLGRSIPGVRRVDRVAFETAHPSARRSLPGDVIITTVPEPGAIVDHDGYAVIEFPARILRVTELGIEQFTPRMLAVLLVLAGRAQGAIRPVQRLDELRLPLFQPDELARFDRLLTELDERHRRACQEIDALDELRRITTTGLTDGTLTITDQTV